MAGSTETAEVASAAGAVMLLGAGTASLGWPSLRAEKPSAWHGHVSFAHWLVAATRPRVVVELGTHNGVSYAAFCNAAERLGLPTRCHAIDSWQGDEHSGAYGEDVFEDLSRFNARYFPGRSTLHRCLFDDALPSFDDGSIDLLHIDGLHTYEAVRHDYETWRRKLSTRAVVLFHDVEADLPGFGVRPYWAELTAGRPSFSFPHSAGLGVLADGWDVPEAVLAMCRQAGTPDESALRQEFEAASSHAYAAGLAARHAASALPERQNAALGRYAMQSSGFGGDPPTPSGAVNGVKTGYFGFHTALEQNPWWMVDLGSCLPLQEIVVYNRLDGICRARSRTIAVLLSADAESWAPLYRHDGTPFGGMDGAPLRIPANGSLARFVRLKLEDHEYLHLDEVEVYV